MIAARGVLGRLTMVACGALVVFGGPLMVFGGALGVSHHVLLVSTRSVADAPP